MFSDPYILFALSIAPALYLAILIYGKDKYDPEPKRVLFMAFLWGCFSALPALALESAWMALGFGPSYNIIWMAVHAFIVVGLSEELSKFVMLRLHAYRQPAFNEPFDGIVYASFVALGFATVENLSYVFSAEQGDGFIVALTRMFTAVPAHFSFGVIMGYYVGLAKFLPERRFEMMFKGVLFATLWHGAYDFFIMQQNIPGLGIITVIVLWHAIKMSRKSIKKMQHDSMFRFHFRNDGEN
jgi:RsiW-degrading membrane proteinase PrsW (M82 family)